MDAREKEEQEVRELLEEAHGQVWNTEEARATFSFDGFMAPVVSVTRKADGVRGTLQFTHMPRFYFEFQEE